MQSSFKANPRVAEEDDKWVTNMLGPDEMIELGRQQDAVN